MIKEKWLKALRSGEFKQGSGNLKKGGGGDNDFHCCLGVLCELAKNEEITNETFDKEYAVYKYEGNDEFLPKSVVKWAELKDGDPYIPDDTTHLLTLSDYNDDGKTFEEVADIIEEHL